MRSAALPHPAPRARVQSFVPALLVLVAGVLAVDAITTFAVLTLVTHGEFMTDWVPFYTGGFIVRSGDAAHLYDASFQASTQLYLFGGIPPMGYTLPAFAAVIFAPMSKLSFVQSYFVWLAINTALLAALLFAGWSWLKPAPTKLRFAFLGGCAAIAFVIIALNAQVDLFVVAGIAACYALMRSERPFTGGAFLAIALFKPHLVVAVVLLLIVKQQWRALGGFAIVGGPLTILPALFLSGPRLFAEQAGLLLSFTNSTEQYRVNADTMISIRGPITALTGSSSVWLWLPLLVVIAAVALYVAIRAWRGQPELHPQSWALALMLPLLYSPHVHFQSVALLLAAAGLYLAADQAGAQPRVRLEHLLLAFVAIQALWLLTIAGLPLTVFYIIAAYTLFARQWPNAAAVVERHEAPALAA